MNQLTLESQPVSEYRTIQLNRSQVTHVDTADYSGVARFPWYADWTEHSQTFYAVYFDYSGPKKRKVYLHRMLMGFPVGQVDHRDHDGLNNRRYNLRVATKLQNRYNSRTLIGTSGYLGVSWHSCGKWAAGASVENKRVHLGLFHSPIVAALVRDRFVLSIRGDFANLNFPRGIDGIDFTGRQRLLASSCQSAGD